MHVPPRLRRPRPCGSRIALLALLLPALAACQAVVTFDPFDAGPADGDDGGPDFGEDGADPGEIPPEADVDAGDGEATEADDAEPEDADGDAGDDGGDLCGNGTLDPGEQCDGDPPEECTTACATAGLRACVDCRWGECATGEVEACNDLDDDCDGSTDEGFPCRAGAALACTTVCGTAGSGVCTARCEVPSGADCTPPADVCNGVDDDCSGRADDPFACVQGFAVGCTTVCGTAGTGLCDGACNPPEPLDCPPPAETCNRADDDCDTQVDEGLWAFSPTELRLTASVLAEVRPAVHWNADSREYGVAYEQQDSPGVGGNIFFTRIAAGGSDLMATDALVSTETGIPADGYQHQHPTLAWSGSEWGVAWSWISGAASEIYFRRLNTAGSALDTEVPVTAATGASSEPWMVWTGTHYGLGWNDARDANLEIYFVRLTTAGTKVSADLRLTATTSCISSRPSVAWTGSEYGLAWYEVCGGTDPGDVYFTRVRPDGTEVPGAARAVVVARGTAQTWPRLVWNGSGFGLAWLDDRDGGADQVYFARLDASGVVVGSAVALTTAAETPGVEGPPALGWDPALLEYLLVWADMRHALEVCGGGRCGTELYLQRLDAGGRSLGAPARGTVAAGRTWYPAVARAHGTGITPGWAVVWVDERHLVGADGNSDIYFSDVRCR